MFRPRLLRAFLARALIPACVMAAYATLGIAPALADCTGSGNGNYTCSGMTTDTIRKTENSLNVTADSTFHSDVDYGSSLVLTATAGQLSINQELGSSIYGWSYGINATNSGTGATYLTVAGSVSAFLRAINVINNGSASDLIVNQTAGSISSAGNGIQTTNNGTGATSITIGGSVSGTGGTAISATNGPTATDLTITQTADSIISGIQGLVVNNSGTGATVITTAGTVTATTPYAAIQELNGLNSSDVIFNQTGGTIEGLWGVSVLNSGTGATTATTAGNISGSVYDGLFVRNGGTGNNLTVTQMSGTIIGGLNGIDAVNTNGTNTAVSVAGTVTGGTGAGINTSEGVSTAVAIDLKSGANVSATSGVAIRDSKGDAAVTLESGSTLTGAVRLGNGNDSVTVIGSANIGGTAAILDGGDATDSAVTDTLAADQATNKLTFLNTSQTLTGANLLNWQAVTLASSSITLADGTLNTGGRLATGLTENIDGSQPGVFLTDGTTLYSPVALAVSGDVWIDASSMLVHDAGGTITGDVSNAGLIYWSNLGQTLTIAGNYTGVAGSQLSLETYLAGDSSATDRLAVAGNTAGSSMIVIRPVAGSPGGLTTIGIDVVEVGGDSAGSFTLANSLQAGAYQYVLKQGGNGGNAGDWYLASNIGSTPIYRPGVGTYVSGQSVNAEEGYFSVSSFHERRGENTVTDAQGRQTWVRPYYFNTSAAGKSRFSYSGAELYGVQAGQDLWATTTQADTSVRAAFVLGYVRSDAAFDDRLRPLAGLDARVGTMLGESFTVGGTYSRVAASGAYIDVLAAVSSLRNKFTVADTGTTYQNGMRVAGSVEVGKPFAVAAGWQIEPQAQLIYLRTHYSAFADAVSSIAAYDANALRGRFGARISNPHLFSSDGRVQLYGIADVMHDFIEPAKLAIGGTEVSDDFRHTGFDIGLGGQYRIAKATSIYGRGLYLHAFDNGRTNGYLLSAGLKTQF